MRKSMYLLLAAAVSLGGSPPATGGEIGSVLGPLELTTLSGERIVMENYNERPATAVLFLSSRSEAVERALVDINRLHLKYRIRDVLVVGICANPAETADELRTFAQRRGLIFPIYRDPQRAAAERCGAQAVPEVLLLDRQGTLVFRGGLQDEPGRAAYDAAILSLLRKQPIATTAYPAAGTPIDEQGEPRTIDDHYGTISFSSELVFEKIPTAAAHHCSTICEAGNHDLLCLWYGGTYESAHDQTLFLARRKAGEKDWSTPEALLQNALKPPGNGVIFRDAEDRLWIVWGRMEATRPLRRGSGWDRCLLFYRTSSDQGRSWSEDKPLLDEPLWCVPRNPPITLAGGTMLLPVEGSLNDVEGSHFLVRPAGAVNWRRAGFTSGGSQPAVVQRSDGSLLALMRHSRFITQITSRDNGQTWSEAEPTQLKNPDAGISMTRLANGHLMLVYNDSQTKRTPLSIVRSLDEGKTWEEPLALESNPGEYSYPCIIQAGDGTIHITYTFRRYAIKHVALNEDWFVHFERPD